MGDDIIYDTSFYDTLEGAVGDFRKALTKRWQERVALDIGSFKYDFPTGFHRHRAPYGENSWDYWSEVNKTHFIYGECEVVAWAEGGQEGDVPECAGETNSPGKPLPPMTWHDDYGNDIAYPDGIYCGMPSMMRNVEYWAHGEGSAILNELPKFDAHDQRKIEAAQEALLTIGGHLGLVSGGQSDMEFDIQAASNADLTEDAAFLAGKDGMDPVWYQHWTGLAADAAKDGFFTSVNPTLANQAGIAGRISNLYAARGTIIQQGRAGDLDLLNKATKALDETQTITHDLDGVWQTFSGVGTALAITGPIAPWLAAGGAGLSLIGIAGSNFAPETKTVEYAHTVEEVVEKVWDLIEDHKGDLLGLENDYNLGVHELRDTVFGIDSFNLEMYDITENSGDGNGTRLGTGYSADVDEILKVADRCFEAASTYEDPVIDKLGEVRAADGSLADESGEEGRADPKVKGLVDEFHGFLKTACARLYTAGEQVRGAAEAYAETDEEQMALFESFNWDEGEAPGHTQNWVQDTDRSGWEVPIPGAPSYVTDTSPGGDDPGDQDYATELEGE